MLTRAELDKILDDQERREKQMADEMQRILRKVVSSDQGLLLLATESGLQQVAERVADSVEPMLAEHAAEFLKQAED